MKGRDLATGLVALAALLLVGTSVTACLSLPILLALTMAGIL